MKEDDLRKEIVKLKKINKALMDRVESSVMSQGNAFSLFESNVLLTKKVASRTEELNELNERLSDDKGKLSQILRGLPGEMIVINSEMIIKESFVGVTDSVMEVHPGEHLSKRYPIHFCNWVRDCLLNEMMLDFTEFKRGSDRTCHASFSRIGDNSFAISHRDISADILAKEKIKRQETAIIMSSRLSFLGEMAAGVGHEINNPLTISVLNINAMKREMEEAGVGNDRMNRCVGKIEHANERILRIIDGLKAFVQQKPDLTDTVSVDYAIDQTLNLISEIYEKDGIQISKNEFDRSALIYGKMSDLQQILFNLITNAKNATEGQEDRVIGITLLRVSGKVVCTVKDNGRGMTKETKDKIFNPLFTTRPVGKGLGMGLGLVNEYVKMMGGNIKVASDVGKGSSFTVTFPEADVKNISKSS